MFAVKIFNEVSNRSNEFNKTISNILNYLCGSLNRDAKVISDNSCIEVISGSESEVVSDGIITELLIKKTLFINNNDLEDRDKLDKYISEIQNFCKNADSIEDVNYVPFQIRISNQEK